MKLTLGVLAASVVLASVSAAQAGVYITKVEFDSPEKTIYCYGQDVPYTNAEHTWSWNTSGGTMIDEQDSATDLHKYSFYTNQDPLFHIVHTITNTTSYAWDKYIVTITGESGTVLSTPISASPYLQTANLSPDGLQLEFTGAPVPVGATQTFDYYLVIPDTGGNVWNFTMNLTAVPEPASLAVLGLGAAALLRRRKVA